MSESPWKETSFFLVVPLVMALILGLVALPRTVLYVVILMSLLSVLVLTVFRLEKQVGFDPEERGAENE